MFFLFLSECMDELSILKHCRASIKNGRLRKDTYFLGVCGGVLLLFKTTKTGVYKCRKGWKKWN